MHALRSNCKTPRSNGCGAVVFVFRIASVISAAGQAGSSPLYMAVESNKVPLLAVVLRAGYAMSCSKLHIRHALSGIALCAR